MTYETSRGDTVIGRAAAPSSASSYVEWTAILAGAVFAVALSLILLGFGAALGLTMTSPYEGESASAMWVAIAAGLWFVWTMVSSHGAGGYLAGRMRRRFGDASPEEVEARDGFHGLMVWATGALAGAIMVATGVGGALGAGGAVVGAAAELAGEADGSYYASLLTRGGPGADPVDPQTQAEVTGIIGRGVTTGEIVERDRAYLAGLVAERAGLDLPAARQRVDAAIAEIDGARATAVVAAERGRVATIVFGFIVAATMLASAGAAYAAAALGGRHRDEGRGLQPLASRA